ncbi:metallopeptidase family protein [Nocardioides sp.]|uniref:metallopeptidase family protein n=1 Tax=Nocardioides sp. TaxID=35761 RepID=UPI002C69FD90|nr:metallopeptidase family protein [Nocardioides sp.]HSX66734.1 metallopeptidase family protein [Nocardioides sp.]
MSVRDRRGRGMRGPGVMPAWAGGVRSMPARPTTRERFDDVVLAIADAIDGRWERELRSVGSLEYAVEDTPLLPEGWAHESIPLASMVRGTAGHPHRLVLFRRPIEHRAPEREDLEALVFTLVVENVADLLGLPAEDIDPRYRPDDQ